MDLIASQGGGQERGDIKLVVLVASVLIENTETMEMHNKQEKTMLPI